MRLSVPLGAKKLSSCALSALIALSSFLGAVPAGAQGRFEAPSRGAAPGVDAVPRIDAAPSASLDATPTAPVLSPAAVSPADAPAAALAAETGAATASDPPEAAAPASAEKSRPADAVGQKDSPEDLVGAGRRRWDRTGSELQDATTIGGSAFGVGDNHTVAAHAQVNEAIKAAFSSHDVTEIYGTDLSTERRDTEQSAIIKRALMNVMKHSDGNVEIPGLGAIPWKPGLGLLKRVIAVDAPDGSPALRYLTPDDYQVSHMGFERGTIYIDSKMLAHPSAVEGILINDLIELSARSHAKLWTPQLAEQTHQAAATFVKTLYPSLADDVRRLVVRAAGEARWGAALQKAGTPIGGTDGAHAAAAQKELEKNVNKAYKAGRVDTLYGTSEDRPKLIRKKSDAAPQFKSPSQEAVIETLRRLASRKIPTVTMPGLGRVDLKGTIYQVEAILSIRIKDGKALRYAGPDDFQMSDVGIYGTKSDPAPHIYLDSSLFNQDRPSDDVLEAVLFNTLFEAAAKLLAHEKEVPWTPELARQVQLHARELAKSSAPELPVDKTSQPAAKEAKRARWDSARREAGTAIGGKPGVDGDAEAVAARDALDRYIGHAYDQVWRITHLYSAFSDSAKLRRHSAAAPQTQAPDQRAVFEALQRLNSNKIPGVQIPGLGTVALPNAVHEVQGVYSVKNVDRPGSMRYVGPDDFQMSYVKMVSAQDGPSPLVYLDQSLFEAGRSDVLLAVLFNDLFEVRARMLALEKSVEWTPALERRVQLSARELAKSALPLSKSAAPAPIEVPSRNESRKKTGAPKRRLFRFESRIQIIAAGTKDDSSLYLEKPGSAQPELLAKGRVAWFPDQSYQPKSHFQEAIIGDAFWVFTMSGAAVRLPLNVAKSFRTNTFPTNESNLTHEGKQYRLYSVGPFIDNPGETFLFRDDGKFIRLDYGTYAKNKKMRVKDGILTIPGCPREVNLNDFEAEAKNEPPLPQGWNDPPARKASKNKTIDDRSRWEAALKRAGTVIGGDTDGGEDARAAKAHDWINRSIARAFGDRQAVHLYDRASDRNKLHGPFYRPDSQDSASVVTRALQRLLSSSPTIPQTEIPGLGTFDHQQAIFALQDVWSVNNPNLQGALRFEGQNDFQMSHAGMGGSKKERAPAIYLNAGLTSSENKDVLLAALFLELFEVRARDLANKADMTWTPELARRVRVQAREFAATFTPSLEPLPSAPEAPSEKRSKEAAPRDFIAKDSRLSFTFDSGVELVSDGTKESSKLTIKRSGGAEPELLAEGAVSWFPGKSAKADSPFQEVMIGKEFWIFTKAGKSIRLPLNAAKAYDGKTFASTESDLTHAGKRYRLYSVSHRGLKAGETFLVRDDGKFLRLDHKLHPNGVGMKVHDGILTIKDSPRRIDLDRFEGEAHFSPKPPQRVRDQEGEIVKDPLKLVEEEFPDPADQLIADPGNVFDVANDPENAALFERMRMALIKPESGNVALLGTAGGGKTEIVKAFMVAVRRGDFPEIPRTTRFIGLDALSLGQGSKYVGSTESRLKSVVETCRQLNCIIFMDEMHSLRGQGTHSNNTNDDFQYLKGPLADGTIHSIATDTEDEYFDAFGGDTAIFRRFERTIKPEPSDAKVLNDLKGWLKRYGKERLSDDALKAVVRLSNDFDAVAAQPSKATKLLAHVYSMLTVKSRAGEEITEKTVMEAAASLYGLDPDLFDREKGRLKVENLADELDKTIVGQDWAKAALVALERQRFANAQDPTKPAIRMLEAGPKGVGKTALGFAFAKAMGRTPVRIEMNKYAEGGVEDFPRELARAIQKDPFSVLILDEFEKAHPSVQLAILALLDTGFINVREKLSTSGSAGGANIRYSFRNASVIMTTNAGEEFVQDQTGYSKDKITPGFTSKPEEDDWAGFKDAIEDDGIPDTVLDRAQAVVAALPPTREQFEEIIDLHLDRVLAELTDRQGKPVRMGARARNALVDYAAERFFEDGMSNRVVLDIASYVRTSVADALFDGSAEKSDSIEVKFSAKKFEASYLSDRSSENSLKRKKK